MKYVEVGNIVVGEGVPKICVSLLGRTEDELIWEAKRLKTLPVQMAEWRVDRFDGVLELTEVCKTLAVIHEELKPMPILFTFRTIQEGGEKEIERGYYKLLNRKIAETQLAEMIDVELFSGADIVCAVVTEAHKHGVKVVGSSHDFNKTPSRQEIIERLREMQTMDVDITKIAVMPTCKKDVLTLMEAILEMKDYYADRPMIAIAMGAEGRISRFAGEFFGSAITFGATEKASAPGQIDARELSRILDIMHAV